ncbi:MAG TPA: heterodisulfide reductase-related iron-sulfur binding cluster [Gemmatimonadales bacterium]|nr:heterodisulfide reductase-related iron-sulfur binding cluster [Gemmatimonadales bacterium]
MTTARGGFAALDACVHCGFCLQSCPTFLATGDEADGPRGRIALMRALELGALAPTDPALSIHLDRCLGCRGCEPVCPSGVGYGHGLEAARERIAAVRRMPRLAGIALWAMTSPLVAPVVYALARALRWTGIPRLLSGRGRIGFAMGMLGATEPGRREWGVVPAASIGSPGPPRREPLPTPHSPVLLFRGCIMDGLFRHVHDATTRTLAVNGFTVTSPAGQVCCGALHAHAGLHAEAQDFARRNISAFNGSDAPIAVNSAGCGALLKDYGRLLPDDPRAARFGARVRDVTELLAERGPAPGGPTPARVAYDPPCHLLHAQHVDDPPRRVLGAIPGLTLVPIANAEQCCGSAGLYSLTEPEMSRAVLDTKIANVRAAAPDVVATGNPGCLMQIGAGLRAAGAAAPVRHPVELLDASYRAAGRYA